MNNKALANIIQEGWSWICLNGWVDVPGDGEAYQEHCLSIATIMIMEFVHQNRESDFDYKII